jgi:hypothetical protein
LRGFFNQSYAAITLGISTIVLFSGVWILSAVATVVFDKSQSKVYFVYKHLGYLQKIYTHPLTSFDQVQLLQTGSGKLRLQLLKDDGTEITVAEKSDKPMMEAAANEISSFLDLPLKS